MITKLTVRGFKGLREFSIEPRRVNLLIGANGTGKTNFADLLAFISSLPKRGLQETIADFGGLSQIRTRQSKGAPYKLHIELTLGEDRMRGIQQAHYSFTLAQSKEVRVERESLRATTYRLTKTSVSSILNFNNPIDIHYQRDGDIITKWSNTLGPSISEVENERELLLASLYSRGLVVLRDYLSSFRSYDIDTVVAKQSAVSDELELKRDGANTVSFVANMLRDPRLRRQILRDLQEVVPYIQEVHPDRLLALQTLRFKEVDTGAEFQPPEMSDGTIRLLGLLAVLRQSSPPPVIVIEEPENGLHAYAIHYILRVARQVAMSERNPAQIFLTTHSPTVVDEVLSLEAMRETDGQTACFVTQRKPGEPSIVPAPEAVMQAIAKNLGRPSDFQREGSFGDDPAQPVLPPALSGVEE